MRLTLIVLSALWIWFTLPETPVQPLFAAPSMPVR